MPTKPRRRALDDFTRSGVSWQPIERTVAYDLLSIAVESGREFTEGMAVADLMYWKNAGKLKTVRDYAGRWQWGKNRVHRLMQELGMTEAAEGERDNAGQDRDKSGQGRDKTGGLEGEKEPFRDTAGQHRDNAGQDRDKDTSYSAHDRPRDLEKEIGVGVGVGVSQAPEAGRTDEPGEPPKKATTPKVAEKPAVKKSHADPRPDDVQQVIDLFATRRYVGGTEEAEAFFAYFESNGWVIGKARTPCKDWRAAAQTWNHLNKKRNGTNGNASHQQSSARPPGKPGTSFQRHQSLTVEQVRWDREQRLARKRSGTSGDPGVPDDAGRDPDLAGRVPVEDRGGSPGG